MDFSNLIEVSAHFSVPQNCIDFVEDLRWKGKPVCMYCNHDKLYRIKSVKRFQCPNCNKQFSAIKGTIFEKTKIPLQKWLVAMYILSAHKKGISSYQLAKDISVTQPTAWFMLHRLRGAMVNKRDNKLLTGIVELDETYMGRKYRTRYKAISPKESARLAFIEQQKIREGGSKKRTLGAVIGIKQRDGEVRLKAVPHVTSNAIRDVAQENIHINTQLMTDESLRYRTALRTFLRKSVNHSSGEWVREDVHTNGIENVWSVMKRGIHGIYHQISYKHLQSYCDEFAFRYNTRFLNDAARFKGAFRDINNRVTFKELIADEEDYLDELFNELKDRRKR